MPRKAFTRVMLHRPGLGLLLFDQHERTGSEVVFSALICEFLFRVQGLEVGDHDPIILGKLAMFRKWCKGSYGAVGFKLDSKAFTRCSSVEAYLGCRVWISAWSQAHLRNIITIIIII